MMFILIFLIDLVVAFAWASGIKAIACNRALAASLWSGFITLAAAVSIISYNINNWLLIPATLGSMMGTYLSVKLKSNEDQS